MIHRYLNIFLAVAFGVIAKASAEETKKFDELSVVIRNSEKQSSGVLWVNGEPVGRFPGSGMFNTVSSFPIIPGENVVEISAGDRKLEQNSFSDVTLTYSSDGQPAARLQWALEGGRKQAKFKAVRPRVQTEPIKPGKLPADAEALAKKWALKFFEIIERKDIKSLQAIWAIDPASPTSGFNLLAKPELEIQSRAQNESDLDVIRGKSIILISRNSSGGELALLKMKLKEVELEFERVLFLFDENGQCYVLSADGQWLKATLK